jgi:hypothetical protein
MEKGPRTIDKTVRNIDKMVRNKNRWQKPCRRIVVRLNSPLSIEKPLDGYTSLFTEL